MSVYRNRLLRISLPKGEATGMPTESSVIRDFLGGKTSASTICTKTFAGY
ncbi:MAG: hypothetical protein QM300_13770 [Pseudomonadota bacterium]|nr:hypothetical protein [Pseudomonadota bacterium]